MRGAVGTARENEEGQYKLEVPQKMKVMVFRKIGIQGEFLIEQKMVLFNTGQELENPEE